MAQDIAVDAASGEACGASLDFRGHGGKARAGADSWSKLLFQYSARHAPLAVEEILEASAGSEGAAAAGEWSAPEPQLCAGGLGMVGAGGMPIGDGVGMLGDIAAGDAAGMAAGSGGVGGDMCASDDEI